jgi:hypothetical protein
MTHQGIGGADGPGGQAFVAEVALAKVQIAKMPRGIGGRGQTPRQRRTNRGIHAISELELMDLPRVTAENTVLEM